MTDQKPNRLSRKVEQFGLAIVAVLAVVIGLASPAYANLPHFKTVSVSLVAGSSGAATRTVASSANPSGQLPDLSFSWTEVGLGKTDVTYTAETTVTATFGCVNGGGKRPSATNKTTVTGRVQGSDEFPTDKNGQVSGSITVPTHSVSPTGFSCPSGQTLVALSATFTDNTITDETNTVTATDEDILWP